MKAYVETDAYDGKWSSFWKNARQITLWQVDDLGRPIIWTCGDLIWKRIWHSIWIAAGLLALGSGIIIFPLLP